MMNKQTSQPQLTKANSTKVQRPKTARTRRLNKPRPRRTPRRKITLPDPYTICRLNPFASKGSTGIPDGTQVRKLVVDHRLTTNISFGSSGSVGIMIVPALPSYVWIYPMDGDTQINSVPTALNYASNMMIPVCTAEWYNQSITYNNTAGKYNDLAQLYSASRARIVSGAWQICYLGTSLTNSGIVRVNTAAFTVGDAIPNNSTYECLSWPYGSGSTTYSGSQILMRPASTTISPSLFTQSANTYDTTMTRLSKGCHGLLKHSGAAYEFKEVLASHCFLSKPSEDRHSMLLARQNTPTIAGDAAACQFYDNDWDATFITLLGGTPGNSFLLDTVLCVEYAPSTNSTVYALAKHGRPMSAGVLRQTEAQAGQLPNSSPGSFATSVMSAAKDVAGIASAVAAIAL